jgi:hypothetical protein
MVPVRMYKRINECKAGSDEGGTGIQEGNAPIHLHRAIERIHNALVGDSYPYSSRSRGQEQHH